MSIMASCWGTIYKQFITHWTARSDSTCALNQYSVRCFYNTGRRPCLHSSFMTINLGQLTFKHLPSLITAAGGFFRVGGGGMGSITWRTVKIRTAFANLRHSWCRHNIRLSLERGVCSSVVRNVRLCLWESWPLHVWGARGFSAVDYWFVRSIVWVYGGDRGGKGRDEPLC